MCLAHTYITHYADSGHLQVVNTLVYLGGTYATCTPGTGSGSGKGSGSSADVKIPNSAYRLHWVAVLVEAVYVWHVEVFFFTPLCVPGMVMHLSHHHLIILIS